jgi:hypothetical protein
MELATLLGWVPEGVGGDVVSLVLFALVLAALWALVRVLERA